MLRQLVHHAGQLVTRDELFETIWSEAHVSDDALTVCIRELRRALGDQARSPQYIETVRSRGYRFIAPAIAMDAPLIPSVPVAARHPMERRLAAIFSADVQGYSRLMEHDDEATVYTLTTYRAVMATLIEQHHGRVVDAPGDNLLAEFASVVDAMESAVAIQQELAHRNHTLDYLPESGVAAYLSQRLELASAPPVLVQRLYQKTNGNPLFLRTMVDAIERQAGTPDKRLWGDLKTFELEVPEGIQQLIVQQFEQLTPNEQALLEVGGVAGAEFSAATLAIGDDDTIDDIEAQCAALARRGQFIEAYGTSQWPDGTVASRYHFIHGLYRETLYERVTAGRRRRWHQQIGLRLEAAYGGEAREIATELADHFEHGTIIGARRTILYARPRMHFSAAPSTRPLRS